MFLICYVGVAHWALTGQFRGTVNCVQAAHAEVLSALGLSAEVEIREAVLAQAQVDAQCS